MAAETGFLIDGEVYEQPDVLMLTSDEAVILYEYSQVIQEDFAWLPGESREDWSARVDRLMRPPQFLNALLHIAYRRRHPEAKADDIKFLVGGQIRMEAVYSRMGEEDDADNPPAQTSEPDRSSVTSSLEKKTSTGQPSQTSGPDSTTSSDPLLDPLPPIGDGKSGSRSTLHRETLAR